MDGALPAKFKSLRDPAAYDHAVDRTEVIETHISWVVLTGPYAYKIKKPVNLGFLDFSTLERRKHFCEEEVHLNRRLAPQIYLEVVPITQGTTGTRIGGSGTVIEYAVKMRQFDPAQQFDRLLEKEVLERAHIVDAALILARFHQQVSTAAPDSPFGEPEAVLAPMLENFRQLAPRLPQAATRLAGLEEFTRNEFARLQATLANRKQEGFVRECHGDVHLRNMALVEGRVTFFDCIEFSDSLRWIDVMSEVAFLAMDLEDRGAWKFARAGLNTYLSESGDYAGLAVLRFYQLYRALVRAKVEAIRMGQEQATAQSSRAEYESCEQYLTLAEGYSSAKPRFLAITHGLSGSGKTTLTERLIDGTDAIRLRSDVERKRLFGLRSLDRQTNEVGAGIYGADASERTYARLTELADRVLAAGYPVIVDAAFLRHEQRRRFQSLAAAQSVPFIILDVQAPLTLLRARVQARTQEGKDASDANLSVLENQLETHEDFTADERACAVAIDGSALPESANAAAAALRRLTAAIA